MMFTVTYAVLQSTAAKELIYNSSKDKYKSLFNIMTMMLWKCLLSIAEALDIYVDLIIMST